MSSPEGTIEGAVATKDDSAVTRGWLVPAIISLVVGVAFALLFQVKPAGEAEKA